VLWEQAGAFEPMQMHARELDSARLQVVTAYKLAPTDVGMRHDLLRSAHNKVRRW
jgi:hypothetical protein